MSAKSSLLVSALAVLDVVSASAIVKRQEFDQYFVWNLVQGDARIGDACHPYGKWTLGTDKDIPPCMSELGISVNCGRHIKIKPGRNNTEEWKATKQCFAGGNASYYQDAKDCLACKKFYGYMSPERVAFFARNLKMAEDLYRKEYIPEATPWEVLNGFIQNEECKDCNGEPLKGWDCFKQLPPGNLQNLDLKPQYKPREKPQNYGPFTYKGITYPKISLEANQRRSSEQRDVFLARDTIGSFEDNKYTQTVAFVGVSEDSEELSMIGVQSRPVSVDSQDLERLEADNHLPEKASEAVTNSLQPVLASIEENQPINKNETVAVLSIAVRMFSDNVKKILAASESSN